MKKYKFETWNVAFRKSCKTRFKNTNEFISLKNPLFSWAADPFILFNDGKYYIFAELYNRLTYLGHIGCCVLNANGKVVKRWKKVLSIDSHLSFPYIYKTNNNFYMMPESSSNKRVSIFRATKFPYHWELCDTIIDGFAYADSVFLDNNHLYTYDNCSRPRKAILYEKKNGVWKKSWSIDDHRIRFRPAGKPFIINDKEVIPLQDSESGEYGGSTYFIETKYINNRFNGVLELGSLLPNDLIFKNKKRTNCVGVHTYNFDNNLEVIDYKTYTFNFLSLIGYIVKRIKQFKHEKK